MNDVSPVYSEEAYAAYAAVLKNTEWFPREDTDRYNGRLRRQLVQFAYQHSLFYRERLAPLFRHGDEPDLSAWNDIPILQRSDIVNELDRINPVTTPEEIGPVYTTRTSGTTSEQLTFRTCGMVRAAAGCMMQRLYRWHGYDLNAPMASIRYYGPGQRPYPEGISETRWSFPGPPAPHYTIDVHEPTEKMIDWLVRRRPAYLLTFPSVAQELANHPHAERLTEVGIKGVVGISEIVTDDAREDVRAAFNCEIAQIYASGEVSAIALQSPVDKNFLICEEMTFVEILDDVGDPVPVGEIGRVVLTSLYNYATPMIRYDIGDFANFIDSPCPSGRTLRRFGRVEGRKRNALIATSGRVVWPSAIKASEIRRYLPSRQFQIRQFATTSLEIIYVPSQEAEADRNGLMIYFADLLGHPVEITLSPVERIIRSPGGKHDRTVTSLA